MIYFLILVLIPALDIFIKNRKTYCITVSLMLFLLPVLRANFIGQDTPQYYFIYNTYKGHSMTWMWNAEDRQFFSLTSEFGYFLLSYFVSRFADFNFFKAIQAAFAVLPACWVIYRYSKRPWLAYFVFYTLPIYTLLSMSAFRQGIAFGICMIAFHFVIQRKIWAFIITVILAWTFHSSSLVFLLVWPFSILPYRRIFNWYYLVLFSVILIFSPIIFGLLIQYSRVEYEAGAGGGERMLVYYAVLFLGSLFVTVKKLQQQDNKIYLYLLMYTTLLWLIGMNLAAIFRLAAYSEFFLALYISNTLLEIKPKLFKELIFYIVLIVSVALFNVLSIAPRGMDYPVSPYYFLWESNKML